MIKQSQHIVPQTYLKQFGYQHGTQFFCSVLEMDKFPNMSELGELRTSQKSIKSFLAEDNIFDLPRFNGEEKYEKILEQQNGILETEYSRLVINLTQNNELSGQEEGVLIQIIANFLCRGTHLREFAKQIIGSDLKDNFLNEITEYHSAQERENFFHNVEISNQNINAVLTSVWYYLIHEFRFFHYALLKTDWWMTTDNPVFIENNIQNGTIISDKTEILFPINKEYCIYLFFPNNDERYQQLKELSNRDVRFVKRDSDIANFIHQKILLNATSYVILPIKLKEKVPVPI